ncbi:hypothetical protein FQA47_014124 [Oryzias melastigma]|uniref:Uncharacterized protein n=1 Tax=Oryzias melastigma TaxID=30732 RepID=A0A834F4W2_ORYME|nr:hypothetical protein FQA47_014124 [Oryzias melastigma]
MNSPITCEREPQRPRLPCQPLPPSLRAAVPLPPPAAADGLYIPRSGSPYYRNAAAGWDAGLGGFIHLMTLSKDTEGEPGRGSAVFPSTVSTVEESCSDLQVMVRFVGAGAAQTQDHRGLRLKQRLQIS